MGEKLPPGFRFHPTDEELITHYLLRKVSDAGFTSKAVAVVDLNKSEPWDLPGKATMGEKEWYFFSMKDRKYPTGLRTNRATESGYWKTTGKDKEIFGAGVLIGMKKTLVFYMGRAPRGEKSNWVMHEYSLQKKHPFTSSKEEWVICRVFLKSSSAQKKAQQTISSLSQDDASPCNTTTSMVNEFGDAEQHLPNLISISNSSNNGFPNNISGGSDDINNVINTNDMNLTAMNFPSGLLNPNLNSLNTLLLKAALHLRRSTSTYDHFATATHVVHPNIPQGTFSSHLATNHLNSSSSNNLNLNNNASNSSEVNVEYCTMPQLEQPFNMDSLW